MPEDDKNEEFGRLEDLTRRLVKVPKTAVDQARKESEPPPKTSSPRTQ